MVLSMCLGDCACTGMVVHTSIGKVTLKFFDPFGTDALKLVVSECKPKAKIVDLCEKGDAFIRE